MAASQEGLRSIELIRVKRTEDNNLFPKWMLNSVMKQIVSDRQTRTFYSQLLKNTEL
jgi:hypothetical protein